MEVATQDMNLQIQHLTMLSAWQQKQGKFHNRQVGGGHFGTIARVKSSEVTNFGTDQGQNDF